MGGFVTHVYNHAYVRAGLHICATLTHESVLWYGVEACKVYVCVRADCRFMSFAGGEPPLLVALESFATFRNCEFEDFELTVEVFDVSFGGLLHLDNCTFRNVFLRQKRLVATTSNDLVPCLEPFQDDFLYLPDDDAAYDIPVEPIVPGDPEAGMWVSSATISDCLRPSYLCAPLILRDSALHG